MINTEILLLITYYITLLLLLPSALFLVTITVLWLLKKKVPKSVVAYKIYSFFLIFAVLTLPYIWVVAAAMLSNEPVNYNGGLIEQKGHGVSVWSPVVHLIVLIVMHLKKVRKAIFYSYLLFVIPLIFVLFAILG